MTLLLGIDIGTSSAKAVLFDADTSQIIAVAGQEYPIHHPAPDRAEQDRGYARPSARVRSGHSRPHLPSSLPSIFQVLSVGLGYIS